jgi:hypothetical protein
LATEYVTEADARQKRVRNTSIQQLPMAKLDVDEDVAQILIDEVFTSK